MSLSTVLRVVDGAVVLGGRPVLRGIDLTVATGEVVAVLGANGSGKTTLVRAALGLAPLQRGSVELFGTRLGQFRQWRRVGYVPQRITATAGVPASVWEVVSSGRLSHRGPLRPVRRTDKQAVADAIEAVDLADRRYDGCSTLSGGQQQRVLIARALAGEPDVLFLDEPTAGVDLAHQDVFADILSVLVERGTTVVLVAHETGAMTPLISRTVVMRDGRVDYDGPPTGTLHDAPHEHAHHPASRRDHVDYRPELVTPVDWARKGDLSVSLLATEFVQRALLAALVTGLAAPAVGTYIVQRRQALMGDGIGHVAVTGVAVGLLTGTSPVLAAIVVAVLAAVVIEVVRERGAASGDVALAMLFYGGIAGGVFITGLAGQSAATLNRFLFGSITTVSEQDLVVTTLLAVVVVVVALGLAPRLFAVAHDPDFARVAGLHVRSYNLLVSVLAAVSVTVAMRTVGLLLVSALMVVPVATAQQLARSFRTTLLAAMVLGTAASVGGVLVSANVDVQPGATIVLLALAGFAAAWPLGIWTRHRRRQREPFPEVVGAAHAEQHVVEEHTHEHGPDCGHPAVPHGDHVDYVHDGHRHAPHGGHYDEH